MTHPPQSSAGAGIAARRLLRNIGAGLRDIATFPLAQRLRPEWVVVRLDRGLVETPAPASWLGAAMRRPPTLAAVLECLDCVRRDSAVQGVFLRLGGAPLGWAKVSALDRAIRDVRAAGKKVVAYADGTGNAGAWLGALADHFWMAPEGRLDLLGVRIETPFVRDALDKLDIQPQVIAAGRYKSAGESLERVSHSRPAREALEGLVERLYDALVDGLARGRAGNPERASEWIDGGPYVASQARDAGLVDELVYTDEIPARLAALRANGHADDQEEARLVGDATYLSLSGPRFRWESLLGPGSQVAVVPVQGFIRPGPDFARAVIGVLKRLGEDPNVCSVVVRIDSRGGDPLASDQIWRAITKLREQKPVVASMGDIAASGGYWIAMAANEIVAEATTLTGSIGVVMAGLELEGLVDRLGVRFEAIERGRHAGIYDPFHARTQEERALLRKQVELLYKEFVRKAAEGRGLSHAELERVAQGRVWIGTDAHEHGLVDHLGGIDTAVERARALAGLSPDEGRVVHLTVTPSLWSRLLPSNPIEGQLQGVQLWCPIAIRLR